jgi:DedD protein
MHSNPDSGQGFELKHRIVGALLLIVAAVAVLSIVLRDGEQAQRPPADLPAMVEPESLPDIDRRSFVSTVQPLGDGAGEPEGEAPQPPDPPAQDEAPSSAVVSALPLDDDSASAPVEAPPETAAAGRPAETPAEAEPTPDVAPEPEPEPEPATVAAAAQPAATPDVGWIVQIGTFANPENARRLGAMLRENGFEPRTTEIETGTGKATRVWVGPVETRVEAARLRGELEKVTGEEGLIASYP